MMPNVKVIPQKLKRKKATRVAAYTRVSSPKAEMIASLSAQVDYYNNLITANPDWELCGIYVDEAKTGTKDTRENFRRLIDDCRQGLIDLVITKSVSRFARNTVDLLSVCRELREHGVDVYFENQDIHSISSEGELMLTLLASIAQEQSRSDSENQKWRIRKNFEEGKPWNTTVYGYRFKNGKFVIEPREAEVVKEIYRLYIDGLGYGMIAKELNRLGAPTMNSGDWSISSVHDILNHYVYTGNLLLQRFYIENHLTKLTKRNHGELPMFKVLETHEPIISEETWLEVQTEIVIRNTKFKGFHDPKANYPFTGIMYCACCGEKYRRKTAYNRVLWICSTYNKKGKKFCAESKAVPEDILITKAAEVMNTTVFDAELFRDAVKKIIVGKNGILTFQFNNGQSIRKTWGYPSRADSWTPEMKAKASEYGIIGRRIQCQGLYE